MKMIYGKTCTKKIAEEWIKNGASIATLLTDEGKEINFLTCGKLLVKEGVICSLNGKKICVLTGYANDLVKGAYYLAK